VFLGVDGAKIAVKSLINAILSFFQLDGINSAKTTYKSSYHCQKVNSVGSKAQHKQRYETNTEKYIGRVHID
jgi:hypothetical protein